MIELRRRLMAAGRKVWESVTVWFGSEGWFGSEPW